MTDDIIEKPSCKILYRQSSLETRLSPIHLSENSSSESEDEGEKDEKAPKIVECKPKLEKGNDSKNNHKAKVDSQFKEELRQKLDKNLRKRKDGYQFIPPNNNFPSDNEKKKISEVKQESVMQEIKSDVEKEDISIVGTLKGKIEFFFKTDFFLISNEINI